MPVLSRDEIAPFLLDSLSTAKSAQSGPRKRKLVSFVISVRGAIYRLDFKPGTKQRPHWARLYQELKGEEYKVSEAEEKVTKDSSDIECIANLLNKAIELDLPEVAPSFETKETLEMTKETTPKKNGVPKNSLEDNPKPATPKHTPVVAVLPLSAIQPRVGPDTRRVNIAHMVHLAESIAVLGILQPLVVDQSHHLLAGGHRLAALHLLAITDPEERVTHVIGTYGEIPGRIKVEIEERIRALEIQTEAGNLSVVPVHVLGFDSAQEPDIALEVESSENALRHDYSAEEVKGIYDRLVAAGYTDRRGKPREGERAARPAIATIIGRSLRTVRRMLNADVALTEVNRTSAGLRIVETLERQIEKSVKELQAWAEEEEDPPNSIDDLLGRLQVRALKDRFVAVKKDLGWTKPRKKREEGAPTHEQMDTWQERLGVEVEATDRRGSRWKRLRSLILMAIKQLGLDIKVEGLEDEGFRDEDFEVMREVMATAKEKKRGDKAAALAKDENLPESSDA